MELQIPSPYVRITEQGHDGQPPYHWDLQADGQWAGSWNDLMFEPDLGMATMLLLGEVVDFEPGMYSLVLQGVPVPDPSEYKVAEEIVATHYSEGDHSYSHAKGGVLYFNNDMGQVFVDLTGPAPVSGWES